MKRAYLQNADAMRQIESLALEDQVVDWILAHAEVHESPSTLQGTDEFRGLDGRCSLKCRGSSTLSNTPLRLQLQRRLNP